MATLTRSLSLLATVLLATGPAAAQTDASTTTSFMWKQCDEEIIKLYVDPAAFEALVPPDRNMLLFEGRAWVLVIAQDCPQYWIDGDELGATDEVHMWVAIEGAQDVRPVVGAEQTRAC